MKFILTPPLQFDCITPCKVCKKCGEIKSLCEFRIQGDYVYSYCNGCTNAYQRQYNKTEKRKKWNKEYKTGEVWRMQWNNYQRKFRNKKKAE